ncbi:MAG: late competence development ComFB family protein [Rhodoferax sp.]
MRAINFEQVHNYFERIVFEEVARRSVDHPDLSEDALADVACVALNRLPARYVRHDVDLMFYLTEVERRAIDDSLHEAVSFAFNFVIQRLSQRARSTP